MTNTEKALKVGNTPSLLKKRLLEARSVLARWIMPHFKRYRFDIANKRLVSSNGKYALIWSTGDTNRGSVSVYELKTNSNPRRKRRSSRRNRHSSARRSIIRSLKRYRRNPGSKLKKWKIRGNKAGKSHTIFVYAKDWNDAVLKGSKGKHCLVVRDVVLQE